MGRTSAFTGRDESESPLEVYSASLAKCCKFLNFSGHSSTGMYTLSEMTTLPIFPNSTVRNLPILRTIRSRSDDPNFLWNPHFHPILRALAGGVGFLPTLYRTSAHQGASGREGRAADQGASCSGQQ